MTTGNRDQQGLIAGVRLPLRLVYAPVARDRAAGPLSASGTSADGAAADGATAWRIAGAAADWLRVVAAWPCDHASLRLLPLPRSPEDRSPAGALVIVDASARDRGEPPSNFSNGDRQGELSAERLSPGAGRGRLQQATAACPGVVPYRRRAGRLYLPWESALWPAVSDEELRGLLGERVYVWQPQTGLIAFDPEPWLTASELLAAPAAHDLTWRPPPDGVTLAPRLHSLTAAMTLSSDEILQLGQGDIGEKPGRAGELPPTPEESAPGLRGAAQTHGKKWAAGMADAASKLVPGELGKRLHHWAQQAKHESAETIAADRQHELRRLLKMLEENPDQALRYAPPLSSHAEPRGVSPPTGFLGMRLPNFSLQRLSGSGPAESWEVSASHFQRLRQQYRAAANRELQLGRYRRAAYVFAELLGDFHAAAAALAAGGHFREAATLYQEKLKAPHEAAGCLEKGGHFNEAIDLWRKELQFERAGDLCRRIGQPDQAREDYQRVLASLEAANASAMDIATLLLEKLEDREAAMQRLADAWPADPRVADCLKLWFALTRESDGQHADTGLQVRRQLRRLEEASVVHADTAAAILANWSAVGGQFADDIRRTTQRLVSQQLLLVQPSQRPTLLRSLRATAPGDRLLARDSRKAAKLNASRTAKPGAGNRALRPALLRTFQLDPAAHWSRLTLLNDMLFAAGVKDGRVVVQPFTYNRCRALEPEIVECASPVSDDTPLILTSLESLGRAIFIHAVGENPLQPRPVSHAQWRGVALRTHAGFGRSCVAAAGSPKFALWIAHRRRTRFTLDAFCHDRLFASHEFLADADDGAWEQRPCMSGHGGGTLFATGRTLRIWPSPLLSEAENIDAQSELFLRLRAAARRLASGVLHGCSEAAVGFARGAAWLHTEALEDPISFAEDLAEPEIGFLTGKRLIAAGQGEMEVYCTQQGEPVQKSRLSDHRLAPVAFSRLQRGRQFALLNADGSVFIYEAF